MRVLALCLPLAGCAMPHHAVAIDPLICEIELTPEVYRDERLTLTARMETDYRHQWILSDPSCPDRAISFLWPSSDIPGLDHTYWKLEKLRGDPRSTLEVTVTGIVAFDETLSRASFHPSRILSTRVVVLDRSN